MRYFKFLFIFTSRMHTFDVFHKKKSFFFTSQHEPLNFMLLRFLKKDIQQFSDEELLKAYQDGRSQEMLAVLFTRYTHMVYGVCMKYLKNPDDASDAVMNIYEKLQNDLYRHQIVKFSTWLYVITKNFCLMELRQRQSKERQHNLWQESQEFFMESEPFLHPIDDLERHSEQLKLCIEQLRDEQKACIELFYWQCKCYTQIAESLNIDEKKVKSYLQNGKRNLKICLENAHDKE